MNGRSYRKASTPASGKDVKTDWLSWSLQAIFGLAAGGIIGVAIYFQVCRINTDHMKMFICGSGLIGAGLGSFFGDRLWMQLESKYEMPQNVKAGIIANIISWTMVLIGISLAVYALKDYASNF